MTTGWNLGTTTSACRYVTSLVAGDCGCADAVSARSTTPATRPGQRVCGTSRGVALAVDLHGTSTVTGCLAAGGEGEGVLKRRPWT
jgi:hypothetical protein